ncbi:MAG: hypothetical protein AAGA23_02440 [Pseudomonadota bacterium]
MLKRLPGRFPTTCLKLTLTLGLGLLTAVASCALRTSGDNAADPRLLILGQDLGAIRGYLQSDCCGQPGGATAYLDFYNLVSASGGYGGLGMDVQGQPLDLETDWGGGPVNAYKTATEFGVRYLAVGLSITENDHPGGLDQLVRGERAAEIRQLARFARSVDVTILLRIGYEFDGFWNQGYDDAARYVAAFRTITDGLREAGVTNVQTVWQGAASTTDMVLDEGRHDNLANWYPGDDYVDWFGLSWFMHPQARPGVELAFSVMTPEALSDEILTLARQAGKPVLIAEASPQGYDLRDRTRAFHSPIWDGPAGAGKETVSDEEIWDGWFAPLFAFMEKNRDVIRGLAYINVRWDEQDLWDAPYESGYWGDSRLEVNPAIADRFNRSVRHWQRHD